MKNYNKTEILLTNYFKALNALKQAGITLNKKDFTSQLGEWLISEIYDGTRAKSNIQKYWDVKVGSKKIQVKTHAKASKTKARWSRIKYDVDAEIDELVIVVFSEEYKLKEFYVVPWIDALKIIVRSEKIGKDVIYWNHLSDYKLDLKKLPNQNLISLLCPEEPFPIIG